MTKITESDLDDRIRERAAVLAITEQVERARLCAQRSTTGVPIGHGPLAEHAAEPVEFTRLIYHLEHANQWYDTVPSVPDHLDKGNDDDDGMGGIYGLCWAVGITVAALVLALVIASLFGT